MAGKRTMAEKTHSLQNLHQTKEFEEQQLSGRLPLSGSSLSVTSDYSSLYSEQPVFRDERTTMQFKNKRGISTSLSWYRNQSQSSYFTTENRQPSLADEALTEKTALESSKDIGRDYANTARELGFTEAELHEIEDDKSYNTNQLKAYAVILKFMQKQGSDATKGWLAFALCKAGRRDMAETLIGNAEFLRKRREQKTFLLLKEDGHVCSNSAERNVISICEDADGILYSVEKLDIPKCEAYRKFKQAVQEPGNIVDDLEFANFKLGRKQNYKEEVEHLQEELKTLEEDLKEIQNTLERQERQEDKIEVGSQLDLDEKQLYKMHGLASKLVWQADAVCRFQEPFIPKSQIYDLSISLSALGKDLEERLKMLLEMTVSDEETLRLNKLLEGCLSLRNNMQENIYLGSLKDLTTKASERRHLLSAPSTQKPRVKVSDDSIKTRLNTMPKSDKELRELEEQTRPQKDPMEKDNVWLPDS